MASSTLTLATTAIAAVGTMASAAASASASRAEGRAAQEAGDFQARQLEQRAGQERASAQRQAIEERRQGRRAQSRATAVAASSGAGASSDPTVQNILAGLQAEGEYNALSALYEGEESARGLETSAAAARYEGGQARAAGDYAAKATRRSGYLSTIGTVTSGASSFYDKYWPDASSGAKGGPGSYTELAYR